MKRICLGTFLVAAIVFAFIAGSYAASKSYQFTGTVKAVDSGTLTVEKSAKETWIFDLPSGTKGGTPKVGDKVTVYYKMVATQIEAKGAATPTASKTAAPKNK